MTINWKYITIFILVLMTIYCCKSGAKIQQQAIKDIYGKPISFMIKDDKAVYYTESGKKIIANFGGVEFNGGRDSLSMYLLTRYINHPEYNFQEYNIDERFFYTI